MLSFNNPVNPSLEPREKRFLQHQKKRMSVEKMMMTNKGQHVVLAVKVMPMMSFGFVVTCVRGG